jgi:hypothetical protein
LWRLSFSSQQSTQQGVGSCGWDQVSRDGNTPKSLIDKLDILSVTNKERDVRYSVYTPRANVEQTFVIDGTTGTYSKVMPKRCRDGFHPIGSSSGEIVGMLL